MKNHITRDDVNNELQKQAAEEAIEDSVEPQVGDLLYDPDSGEVTAMTGVVDGDPDWTTVSAAVEAAEPSMTSSMSMKPASAWTTHPSTTSTGTIYTGGGMVGGTTTWPTGGVLKPPGAYKKAAKKVRLPSKFTEKMLIAFLEEEPDDPAKDVVWAANLEVEMVEMTMEDGELRLVLTLSLEDKYGNNPDED